MGRPAKAPKLKEPVRLRQRERKDGLISLYLDIYQKGIRRNEYLNLYLVPVHSVADRQKNAETLAIAEKVKAQRIIAIQNHKLVNWDVIKRASMTLEDWLEKYDHEEIPLSKSAFVNRAKAHKWMTMFLEKTNQQLITLEEIDKDFCRAFIIFLRKAESDAPHKRDNKGLSQSTIHGYQATIVASLNKAVREGIIDRNPFSMLEAREKVAKKDREREFLTMEEIKILMATPIDHESVKNAFLFSCFTGLRISDILKLTWDDIKRQMTECNTSVLKWRRLRSM